MTTDTIETPPTVAPPHIDNVQVRHLLTAGIYMKVYRAPKGMQVRTKRFDLDHAFILAQGSAVIKTDLEEIKLKAPVVYNIPAHTRMAAFTLEDSVWYCIHRTEETDLEQLAEKY